VTGNSARKTKAKITEAGLPAAFVFCCVYGPGSSAGLVDALLEPAPQPRIYQRKLMHPAIASDACLDIDGVLCRDPTEIW
jgi:hypothetical protein